MSFLLMKHEKRKKKENNERNLNFCLWKLMFVFLNRTVQRMLLGIFCLFGHGGGGRILIP